MTTEPPIIEVAITLHFDRLAGVTALDVAELFQRFGGDFRTVQHLPELPPGTLEGSQQFEISPPSPDLPRTWFVSEDLRYVAQFQADRFSLSWRRLSPQQELEYPGYDEVLRRYRRYMGVVSEWMTDRFGEVSSVHLGELLFVNAVPMMFEGELRRLSSIFTFVAPSTPRRIRTFTAQWAEIFEDGDVNVAAATGLMPDGQPAATLQLAARQGYGRVSIDDALTSLDGMRPHLHSVFETVISDKFWGRGKR